MSDEQYAIQRLEEATGGIRLRGWTPADHAAGLPQPIDMSRADETDDRAAA